MAFIASLVALLPSSDSSRSRTICRWLLPLFVSCLYIILTRYREPSQSSQLESNSKSNPPGTCKNVPFAELPASWRTIIPKGILSDGPWTSEEEALANAAGRKGLDELVDFFTTASRDRIQKLSTNGANAIFDQCIGAFSPSAQEDSQWLRDACGTAARVVDIVAQEYLLSKDTEEDSCSSCAEGHYIAKLTGYANYLSKLPSDILPQQDRETIQKTRDGLATCIQSALDACGGSLQTYLGRDWEADLIGAPNAVKKVLPRRVIRHYVHRSNFLTDLYNIPNLRVPPELDVFTTQLWNNALPNYPFLDIQPLARNHGERKHHAFLVTHAAYLPTGYGRHKQYVQDAPWLYSYIRQNYYAVLEIDNIDLFAEFLDILRQYGCTEENDLMVRHGNRYLLQKFAELGHRWMDDEEEEPDDYDRIHVPWTTTSAVRTKRDFDPVVPGSFGYAFLKALETGSSKLEKVDD